MTCWLSRSIRRRSCLPTIRHGFDNVADVLGVSPVLLERYQRRGKVSALAVGDPKAAWRAKPSAFARTRRRIARRRAADRHRGRHARAHDAAARRRVRDPARLFRTNLGAMRGLGYEHQIEITVDGARVHLASFGGDEDFKASLRTQRWLATMSRRGRGRRFRSRPGRTRSAWRSSRRPRRRTAGGCSHSSAARTTRSIPTGYPHIDVFSVTGPFNATGSGDTPSRREIFICRPATAAEEEPCARRIVSTLARRAYRGRPPTTTCSA